MTLTSSAYLTIDDSPSTRMDDLVDYLKQKEFPPSSFAVVTISHTILPSAIRALQKGFVLANHAYSHQRSSKKDFSFIVDEIEKTQSLLDEIHAVAGVAPRGKYFRFPQLDRGTAGWIVDYDEYNAADRFALLTAFAEGLNVESMDRPDTAAFDKKKRLQLYLEGAGFTQPFTGVTHSWYANGEIALAKDCLYTFSNCDWMLTARHLGKWPYTTPADLKTKALNDPWLSMDGSVNVLLAHDQAEIVDLTIDLIDDLAENGLKFLEI